MGGISSQGRVLTGLKVLMDLLSPLNFHPPHMVWVLDFVVLVEVPITLKEDLDAYNEDIEQRNIIIKGFSRK